ncbi:hypothetical protein EAL2_c12190 [Peptoclostridium acidaminophilum DSM 3953]|uniref:DUF3866 family protein n=1 Tax=Peptoclostridium acidaminophilum DSM 3953 TaxID=1286171 RepID=W8T427_PEPAC|nr:DUF3866 family protein [Peptoclostridium acidaminophilum]AHM56514.1 hypothetical protein EAL2_c12190 [Peptoclostridium acidaminophilum DSM 3953]
MDMLSKKLAIVKSITGEYDDMQELTVLVADRDEKAISYIPLTGRAKPGQSVLLNTTAVELSLGTGGFHFVIANLDEPESSMSPGGHIMKLRYTPYQIKCFAVEEQGSKYHEQINAFESLEKLPVAVGTLHSQLVPFACTAKKLMPGKSIAYIMTDGAALPMYLSKNVKELKNKGLIDHTITCGNAFGGDFESVNVYSAMIFAKQVLRADIIFVCMGPGIAGTGTKYGFTGIEQAYILDAAVKLGGTSIAVPRVSFADKRERHRGISHHTVTVLRDAVCSRVVVPINIQDEEKLATLEKQLEGSGLSRLHEIYRVKGDSTKAAMDEFGMKARSMGRGFDEDEEFFKSASGAASYIAEVLL